MGNMMALISSCVLYLLEARSYNRYYIDNNYILMAVVVTADWCVTY